MHQKDYGLNFLLTSIISIFIMAGTGIQLIRLATYDLVERVSPVEKEGHSKRLYNLNRLKNKSLKIKALIYMEGEKFQLFPIPTYYSVFHYTFSFPESQSVLYNGMYSQEKIFFPKKKLDFPSYIYVYYLSGDPKINSFNPNKEIKEIQGISLFWPIFTDVFCILVGLYMVKSGINNALIKRKKFESRLNT